MDLELVRQINRLWVPVYPGIALQIVKSCPVPPERILELGCFSGGTGLALLTIFQNSHLTVALEYPELVKTFLNDWDEMLDGPIQKRITVGSWNIKDLKFSAGTFDLVVCRGVFFFMDDRGTILQIAARMVTRNGIAFVGGGFGSHTPLEVIEKIADESRRLNYELGKRVVSPEEFREVLDNAGLQGTYEITEEGGLWAVIQGSGPE